MVDEFLLEVEETLAGRFGDGDHVNIFIKGSPRRPTAHLEPRPTRPRRRRPSYGAGLGLGFTHVLFAASTSRLFVPGVEDFIVRASFSKISEAEWLRGNCDESVKKHPTVYKWYFDAVLGGDAHTKSPCRGGFSKHEGMFFPRSAVAAFAAFARETRDPVSNVSIAQRILDVRTGVFAAQAAEEVLLQTFVFNRLYDEWAAARPPLFAGPVCVHWPPRSGVVGAVDAVAYRLGRNLTNYRVKPPYMMKRWTPQRGGVDDTFLSCLGRSDAATRAARGLDGDDLAPLSDWDVQNNTLACIDAVGLDLTPARREFPPKEAKRVGSLLGNRDPYPDLPALAAAVRAWLARSR